jgi:hypothetical protein
MTCEGCGKDGATEKLSYPGPLGLHAIPLHRDRACALAAKAKLGGKAFVPEPEVVAKGHPLAAPRGTYAAHDKRIMAAVLEEVERLRRNVRPAG